MAADFGTVRKACNERKNERISKKLKVLFGYSIMITLFVGVLTFFEYLAALIIGGETAAVICQVIYKKIIQVMIYVNTITVIVGLLTMYLAGEKSLTPSTPDKRKQEKNNHLKHTRLRQSISIRIGA